MSTLTDFLTFEYANAYDLSKAKQYSIPKIYDSKGDLTKRWYVYYSFRNPKTGKLERQTPIYGGANTFHTKEKRLEILIHYQKSLSLFLQKGYNPYENNEWMHKGMEKEEDSSLLIEEAFNKMLLIKKKVLKSTSFVSYSNRIISFKKWLFTRLPKDSLITEVTKKLVINYLNEVLERTSARTRNNTRTDLSSFFQALEDNDIIVVNFIKNINVLKTTPERNKTYTKSQQEAIFAHLEQKDPILLLYIKFISYNLLRPIEVCRLKVSDVDVTEKRIYVRAKNAPVKIKIIPDILINDLPDLSGLSPNQVLFTPDKIGGKWETTEQNRRDYFSKRFKKKVKEPFELGINYGLYSFRHTFITKLYQQMEKTATPFEVKSKLMLITGHSTMVALEKYLRDIDASLPKDYSKYL